MRVATSGDPEARAGRRSRASTLLVQLLLVAATVLGCEAALQLGSAISTRFHGLLLPPWERHAPTLADRHLRGRGNPYNPEHDSAGYRNAGRPERTDIVVPGDSHSYGPTHASDGWAALLGQRLGVGVYNMALPGYGPGQSLLQLDEALSLHPRLVVVAPHFGNDFFDTFALSKLQPQLLKRLDPALIASAEAAEQRGPLEAEILRLYSLGEVAPTSVTGLRGWLSENIRLYGLLRAVAYRLRSDGAATGVLSSDFDHAVASLSDRQRSYAYPLELGD